MAFCNFSSSRNVDLKNSDTQSEVSESGTVTSGFNSNWGSREEIRDFISKHGLKDASDLYQDRFRVDRKKLEQMLSGDNSALIPADLFFTRVMEETDTFITWPDKLKLGAKSRKDPYVRIAGKHQSDVNLAKERIMTILYTRCNRVTMKMDVSYTDHSHIIGRGGLNIKRVMEETQCHVHFPDSNRASGTEKSNQVSISGDLSKVEFARSRVRESMPLIFGFEPPIMDQTIDSTNDPYIREIQEKCNVQVMFRTRSKLHATIVLVKGVEWEVEQVKKATLLLIDYICQHLASQTLVQMSIQISPQHHSIVLGKNHSNLKAIMGFTKCEIIFPDAQDTNIPSLKRSHVTISGSINNVYTARQLLIGSLPLILVFDLPEENGALKVKPEQLGEIQNSCEVTITIRQKSKQPLKACIIKGIERNAAKIYKSRNLILGSEEATVIADIPLSYQMPNITPQSPFSVSDFLPTPTNVNPNSNPISPIFTQLLSPSWQCTTSSHGESPLLPKPLYYGMPSNAQYLQPLAPNHQQQQQQQQQQSQSSSGFQSLNSGSFCSDKSRESSILSSVSSNTSNISPAAGSKSNTSSPQHFKYQEVASNSGVENSEKSPDFNYQNDRYLAAYRAMQMRPNAILNRVPSNVWSGYGLSQTSPATSLESAKNVEDIWKHASPSSPSGLNTSNIVEHTPNLLVNLITSSTWSDLPSLLSTLGLERYISLFVKHEVDLTAFSTLKEEDLLRIGITAFGTRRKMLLAISELNKRSNHFSMAPGAERKASTSTSSSQNSPREIW